jgi:hypothetical protein
MFLGDGDVCFRPFVAKHKQDMLRLLPEGWSWIGGVRQAGRQERAGRSHLQYLQRKSLRLSSRNHSRKTKYPIRIGIPVSDRFWPVHATAARGAGVVSSSRHLSHYQQLLPLAVQRACSPWGSLHAPCPELATSSQCTLIRGQRAEGAACLQKAEDVIPARVCSSRSRRKPTPAKRPFLMRRRRRLCTVGPSFPQHDDGHHGPLRPLHRYVLFLGTEGSTGILKGLSVRIGKSDLPTTNSKPAFDCWGGDATSL